MSNDLFSGMLWSEGEGLTHDDLNNGRGYIEARIFDQLLSQLAPGPLASATTDPDLVGLNGADLDTTSLIFTMSAGCGVLKQGSAATKVGTYGGTIFQKIAAADGEEATFIPYTLVDNEFDLTIGAGDAANPRIDIIQVKLEWVELAADQEARDFEDGVTRVLTTQNTVKKRRVQATISLKAGTAGATPTYPAPDAGYAVLGAVRVPALWATGITHDRNPSAGVLAGLRQCSVPLRVQAFTVTPDEFDYAFATNWIRYAVAGFGFAKAAANGAAATGLRVWCPAAGQGKRIIGVAIQGSFEVAGSVELRTAVDAAGGLTSYASHDLSSVLVNVGAGNCFTFAHLGDIADASPDSDPSAAAGPIGDAYWASGGRSGPAFAPVVRYGNTVTHYGFERAYLDIDGDSTLGAPGSTITAVIWYLAG